MDNKEAKKNAGVAKILSKTSDIGKKVADNVQKGAKAITEKAKNDSLARRIKKYNPVFPGQYHSENFSKPNMIMIVDDAVRRGIDVCEGSMGWLSKENGMEVFMLYDEAIEESKIKFVPSVSCDAVYYVDSFDRNRYIRIDCIFSKAHEEKIAELKHIAYSLGAKRCTIEISESTRELKVDNKSFDASERANTKYGVVANSDSGEHAAMYKGSSRRSGKVVAEFEGSSEPKRPELKWFIHDDNINRLIEMRCEEGNMIKSETIELSGASSATMSQKTAYAIDSTVSKMGVKSSGEMESQATKESSSKMIFVIEF